MLTWTRHKKFKKKQQQKTKTVCVGQKKLDNWLDVCCVTVENLWNRLWNSRIFKFLIQILTNEFNLAQH